MRGALMYRCVRYLSKTQAQSNTLKVGDKVEVTRRITSGDVERFICVTGDTNSVHFQGGSKEAIVHGALLNGFVSGVIGTQLPGPGTLVVSQSLNFPHKCFVNDLVTVRVELMEVRKIMRVRFACEVEPEKRVVLYGEAKLIFDKQN